MTGVAVVIPCFNLGRTLRDAIESVQAQTRPASELVVVDDGSTDLFTRHALTEIQAEGVYVIHTENRGVAGARLTGVEATASAYLLLLDADDMLVPAAIERLAGVLDAKPEVDFVTCGMAAFGEAEYIWHPPACTWSGVFTRGGPHISTMLRRGVWTGVGGFDPDLPGYEDTDFWLEALRMGFRGAALPDVLLRYRVRSRSRYAKALSPDAHRRTMASIQSKHWPPPSNVIPADVLVEKEAFLEEQRSHQRALIDRRYEVERQLGDVRAEIASAREDLARQGRATIDWGDLRRTEPVSPTWGLERGQPVDRYYIERFLDEHREDIQGRVLEVKDGYYTRHFGDGRVTRCDVLDINPNNPEATLVADLAVPEQMPANTYDCIVLTQTTHIIYESRRVVESAWRGLKPGGVLLCTVPCLSRVSTEDADDDAGDFWRFTEAGTRHIFSAVFPLDHLEIASRGNLMSCAAFLLGLAAHEVPDEVRPRDDPWHSLICVVRATKPWPAAKRTRPTAIARHGAGRDGVVLLYHRVNEASGTHAAGIPEADFREQMQHLKDEWHPMSLDTLVEGARASTLPERAVALTFDDGYLEHLMLAAPVLTDLGLPATFYVTTAQLDQEAEFYWDTLDRVLLDVEPGSLPQVMDLFGDGVWTRSTAAEADRRAAHQALVELLYDASMAERADVVGRLASWCGRDLTPRATHRRLTGDEVRSLAAMPGMAVGAHTCHHLRLPGCDDRTLWHEVNDSRASLESLLGVSVTSFAYPYGEFDGRSRSLVAAAGFDHAVTVDAVPVTSTAHRLLVPRLEAPAGGWLAARLERCRETSRSSR